MLGHITPDEKTTDRDLMKLATSIGYADFYVTKPVSFPNEPIKARVEKVMQVRVTPEDFGFIKDLQDKWELPNQQSVVTQLVKKAEEVEHLKRQLMEIQAENNQLQKQLEEQLTMESQQTETVATETASTEVITKDTLRAMMIELLAELQPAQPVQPVAITSPTPSASPTPSPSPTPSNRRKPKPELDYESMDSHELEKLRSDGAVDEKIRRAFAAITDFNDAQPSNQTRWTITNQSLRQVSGCNGQKVRDWMERYQTSISDHNSKYGLGQYDNKGKGDITEIISW